MAKQQTAHRIGQKPRTHDVLSGEDVDFPSLLLSKPLLDGLKMAGFERPSPIQLKTIPLGRCGLDLIVQAKSGTGKTCVFSVIALDSLLLDSNALQVLVLAPTREIAVQIWEVIKTIGSAFPDLRCYTFIGGLAVADDLPKLKRCHIAVGTPGRIKQLIEKGHMSTDSIRLFILDEADKLMDSSFQDSINWIYSCLPSTKQMLALSATYPEVLAQHLKTYMTNPTFVRLNASDPALLGIRQYYQSLPHHPLLHKNHEQKTKALVRILSSVKFHQCLVFSNLQTRAQSLCDQLNSRGWPSSCISAAQDQHHRLTAMAKLKHFKCRVLVSTDLTARGIDAENVNLVVNLDCPRDHETYLHRIGRAGRFDDIPEDLASSSGYVNWEQYITTEKMVNRPFDEMNGEKNGKDKDVEKEMKEGIKKDEQIEESKKDSALRNEVKQGGKMEEKLEITEEIDSELIVAPSVGDVKDYLKKCKPGDVAIPSIDNLIHSYSHLHIGNEQHSVSDSKRLKPSDNIMASYGGLIDCYEKQLKSLMQGQKVKIVRECNDDIRISDELKLNASNADDKLIAQEYVQSLNAVHPEDDSDSSLQDSDDASSSASSSDYESDSSSESESDECEMAAEQQMFSYSCAHPSYAQHYMMQAQVHMHSMQYYQAMHQQLMFQRLFQQQRRYIRYMAKRYTELDELH